MRHAYHVLVDDGAGVGNGCYIVTGCSNEFDSSFIGPCVGAAAHERGQKGMMNIDDAICVAGYEFVRKDLHVTRKNHQINLQGAQELEFLGFLQTLVLRRDRKMVVRNAMTLDTAP